MIEAAIVVARLLQYLGAAILFGTSLFFAYAGAEPRAARPLVAGAAALLAGAALAGIAAQASLFAGSWAEGLTGTAMGAVVSYMALGKAALVRASAALVALVLLALLPRRRAAWLAVAAAGAVAAASLAWMGHAGASEAPAASLHVAADAIHALAAAMWIGALVGFLCLLAGRASAGVLQGALQGFSRIGVPMVLVLGLTGLVNSWFLVGPENGDELLATAYGRWLLVKLALFAGMLGLAAINRYRLTPAIAARAPSATGRLRRSIGLEAALGIGVLAAVAWFGTLPPPAGG